MSLKKENKIKRIAVFLDRDLLIKNDLSTDALLSYVALRMVYDVKHKEERDFIIYNHLTYKLTGKCERNKVLETKIKNGLMELEGNDLIKTLQEVKYGKLITMDKLYFSTKEYIGKDNEEIKNKEFKYFIQVFTDEIQTIMNLNVQAQENVLKYFCILVSTIYNGGYDCYDSNYTDVGMNTITQLEEKSKFARATVLKYNNLLCENGLLFIQKSNQIQTDENGIIVKGFSNCYGRPENKKKIQKVQINKENANGNKGIKKIGQKTNLKRSYTQKLNQIKKGNGLKYSVDEIDNLLNFAQVNFDNEKKYANSYREQHTKGLISKDEFLSFVKSKKEIIKKYEEDIKLLEELKNKIMGKVGD